MLLRYCLCGRNMDIIGVSGISAEAELLAAIVLFLERVGLTSEDIVIKVSSRKVLQAILERYNVPEESVGPVSVVVDKMEKIPLEKVSASWVPAFAKRAESGDQEGPIHPMVHALNEGRNFLKFVLLLAYGGGHVSMCILYGGKSPAEYCICMICTIYIACITAHIEVGVDQSHFPTGWIERGFIRVEVLKHCLRSYCD